jgi:maltooligosyltrehalose trehalohydrolase
MGAMKQVDDPEGGRRLGATCRGLQSCEFLVWAPLAGRVDLKLEGPDVRHLELSALEEGYHFGRFEHISPEQLYRYVLHSRHGHAEPLLRPDPASRIQPQGVHGPSGVVSSEYNWHDGAWQGLPLQHYIIYEVHVGTITAQGTLTAMIPLLNNLKQLGITAVELMPLAEFPGDRNWGYDGVHPFAIHQGYGGPDALRAFVDACHAAGLAVILDVVYNHLGPEGNYLRDFGPYFTSAYHTPWGEAFNFDGPHSDHVRRYFLENVAYWITEFHIDALRFDAVHGIFDFSAAPFLSEVTELVRTLAVQSKRRIYCIAESALNDPRVIRPFEKGGLGFDAQWNDDFHHALHALLTGERSGYYIDFGLLEHMAKAWREGFVYTGEYSRFRKRRHGASARAQKPVQLVVFGQNHDQIGNRLMGERFSTLLSMAQLKLAAASVLFSPFIPLLFMGEEYGEPAPFPYFISHSDPELVAAVRAGRKQEFEEFEWQTEPPDPQDQRTFMAAKIDSGLQTKGHHAALYDFYRELIALRKRMVSIYDASTLDGFKVSVGPNAESISVHGEHAHGSHFLLLHFAAEEWSGPLTLPEGQWRICLDSADERWMGPGSSVPVTSTGGSSMAMILRPFHAILWERFDYRAHSS